MELKNGKTVSDYRRVVELNDLPYDKRFSCILCRRCDHETLEAAYNDGAYYELNNAMSRDEVIEGMNFADVACGMFDDNYGGIDLYVCELN